MSSAALKIISDAMDALGLNYEYMEYHVGKGESLPDLYFVGEYEESPPMNEDGMQEATFILNAFSRGKYLALEEAKEAIENQFNKVSGKTVIADNGSAVAIFYANSLVVPTGNAELKRLQINLTVKEWSVN
jgi:hypothetical protein